MHSLQLHLQLPSCFSYCHCSSGDGFGLSLTFHPHPSQRPQSHGFLQTQGFAAMANTIISSPDLWTQTHIHDTSLVQKGPMSLLDLCQDLTCNQASSTASHVISVLCSLPASFSSCPSERRSSKKPQAERCTVLHPCAAGATGDVPTELQSHAKNMWKEICPS